MAEVSMGMIIIFGTLCAFLNVFFKVEKEKTKALQKFKQSWIHLDQQHDSKNFK